MTGTVVRTTRDRALLDEWALVLSAAAIEHHKTAQRPDYALLVDTAAADEAVAALADYDRERRQRRRPAWPSAQRSTNVAWVVASAILASHLWLGSMHQSPLAYARGANRASAVAAGELWRGATALTLHADGLHAFSNAASGLLFLSPLCQLLGGGTAFSLALASGTVANLLNAAFRGPPYSGIGASTAIFAAVGLLAGARWSRSDPEPFWRRLRPLGAALGILAMLGASPETDVAAHSLGLVVGVAFGATYTYTRNGPLSPTADAAVGVAGVAFLALAWLLARATA